MADIFDTTVTHMKIGIAVPIVNSSFKFWDDPGTWSEPTGWTGANLLDTRDFTGFDADNAALKLTGTSVPNDYSYLITSDAKRFINENEDISTTQDFYYSLAANVSFSTPGAGAQVGIILQTDATEAYPSGYNQTIKSWTSDTAAGLTLFADTYNATQASTEKWARIRIFLKDAVAIVAYFDCLGIMYNPIDDSGYYELTNVFPTNGPQAWYKRLGKVTKTPLGTHKYFDPSGGAEKIRLSLSFRNEDIETYEALKYFYDQNKGTPGLPGLPLLIEPNLPTLPPTIMVNWVDQQFPLTRSTGKGGWYSGNCNFETVW